MKGFLSIKARVTLWYALLMLVVTVLVLVALMWSVDQAALAYHEGLLLQAMADAAASVTEVNGVPVLDNRDLADFDKVSFTLLDQQGGRWQGNWPPFELPFADGAVRQVTGISGGSYLTQDLLLPLPHGAVWLRGYLVLDTMLFLEQATVYRLALLLPLLAVVAALGGYLLTRRAFRPIARMTRQAERILDGRDLTQRFPEGRDEVGRLGSSFNAMLERLSDSFERERRFTDDASHELRTPLAVITAACDFALEQGDEAEYREALTTIAQKAGQMNAMVEQMLQMARMEGGRVSLRREQLDFSALCVSVAEETVRGKQLDASGVEPGVLLWGDELLLMRLVTLLTDNARRYARTCVTLRLERQGNTVTLRVCDDGPGIAPELRERVFDRFFQAESHRGGEHGGAGLGLTLARGIARLHGGDVRVEDTQAPGATLLLELPAEETDGMPAAKSGHALRKSEK